MSQKTNPSPGTDRPPTTLLRGSSLFLDFDGTLVEIAERPDAVSVSDRLRRLLAALGERLDGRLALISGRPAAQVRELFGDPAFMVAGSHGLEFHDRQGRTSSPPRPPQLAAVGTQMADLVRQWPGLLLEEKPLGAALHYRLCPEAENACADLATSLAGRHQLHLQTGKMMVEVRAPGGDKGTALRRLMDDPGMSGGRPVFLGDDDTDEPGFAAAEALGGAGILVGPGRPTAARFRLADSAAVLEWLEAACGA